MHFATHLRAERLGEFTIGTELHRSESLALVQLLILYHLVTAKATISVGGERRRAAEHHPRGAAGGGETVTSTAQSDPAAGKQPPPRPTTSSPSTRSGAWRSTPSSRQAAAPRTPARHGAGRLRPLHALHPPQPGRPRLTLPRPRRAVCRVEMDSSLVVTPAGALGVVAPALTREPRFRIHEIGGTRRPAPAISETSVTRRGAGARPRPPRRARAVQVAARSAPRVQNRPST